jgi:hypothetical protein
MKFPMSRIFCAEPEDSGRCKRGERNAQRAAHRFIRFSREAYILMRLPPHGPPQSGCSGSTFDNLKVKMHKCPTPPQRFLLGFGKPCTAKKTKAATTKVAAFASSSQKGYPFSGLNTCGCFQSQPNVTWTPLSPEVSHHPRHRRDEAGLACRAEAVLAGAVEGLASPHRCLVYNHPALEGCTGTT